MRDQLFMIILYEFMDLIVINIGFASVDKVYVKKFMATTILPNKCTFFHED